VVPKRRWGTADGADGFQTLGASFEEHAAPRRWTCESMKPGSSSCPPRIVTLGAPARAGRKGATMSRMRPSLSSTQRFFREVRSRAAPRPLGERHAHQRVSVTFVKVWRGGPGRARARQGQRIRHAVETLRETAAARSPDCAACVGRMVAPRGGPRPASSTSAPCACELARELHKRRRGSHRSARKISSGNPRAHQPPWDRGAAQRRSPLSACRPQVSFNLSAASLRDC